MRVERSRLPIAYHHQSVVVENHQTTTRPGQTLAVPWRDALLPENRPDLRRFLALDLKYLCHLLRSANQNLSFEPSLGDAQKQGRLSDSNHGIDFGRHASDGNRILFELVHHHATTSTIGAFRIKSFTI